MLGALLRALVGYGKSVTSGKEFKLNYFLLTTVIGIIVGIVVGMMLPFSWPLAVMGGYAGTDFLEGIAKLFRQGKGWGFIK